MRNFFRIGARVKAKARNSSESFDLVLLAFAFLLVSILFTRWAQASTNEEIDSQENTSQIVVKPAVEISGEKTHVTLADLVVPRSVGSATLESLEAVRLADAPKAGETRTFTNMALSEVFKSQIAIIEAKTGERFELKLPSRVTVMRKRAKLTRKSLERELQAQWKAICPDCEFKIITLQPPAMAANAVIDSAWLIRVRPELPRGGFSYPVEFVSKNGSAQPYWVSGQVMVQKIVPVSTRAISAGERLQESDITKQLRDVTYATDSVASDHEIGSGQAARSVAAGQIMWRSSVRRELAIKNGDAVKVTATGNESWQITIDGVAQSSGYVGDLIRVKIPRTSKVVSGLLKEKGVIEVQ